ncbi:DUF4381 domain-containing protein [Lamprobacter modestohalophilus]|uniref:DUF4381 domain-containing protein n=1 Tax=Lamprobacter modestohalophilus TaxID=1064514 RepID=UPI002ADEC848|nr:DUF4381 domain-containing protein [Lamprobacter modestohalophilus]MEA1049270.1 DUF4381 domain-containing protein [Lamprobacter modestohalophilus]
MPAPDRIHSSTDAPLSSAQAAQTMTVSSIARSYPGPNPAEHPHPGAHPTRDLAENPGSNPALNLGADPGANLGSSLGSSLNLRDIHLPAEPGFWPPAPGWWLLFTLLLGGALWLGRLGWGQYRRLRRRQRILAELDRLQRAGLQGPALIAALSALLKRVALSRYPRTEVAALTGTDWLAFLDRSGGNGRFATGPGRVLADGAYAPAAPEGDPGRDRQALLTLVRDWLRRNS